MVDVNEEEKLAKDMDETPIKQDDAGPTFIPRSLISPKNKEDLRPPPIASPPKEKLNLNDRFIEEIEKQCDEESAQMKQEQVSEEVKELEESKEMEKRDLIQ